MTEPSEQTPSKHRVIVVDDEQVIANSLAIILNQADIEARAVFSGEQAIELLESFQPEMLIADVVMPGMTGIKAAIAVRNNLPKCNILLFSGQAATTELLEQARTQGHEFEILAKPVHPADPLEKLRMSSISILELRDSFPTQARNKRHISPRQRTALAPLLVRV
jgi:CheY-like chemotaxis protein